MAKKVAHAPSLPQMPIHVTMLGNLQLSLGDATIDEKSTRSPKISNLLAYLLVHRDRNVPQEELVDILWPDEGSQNPGNALKTLLYRARATLEPLANGDMKMILSQRGAYLWNKSIPCVVDAEEFASLVKQASDTTLSTIHRKNLYRQAMIIYKQDFLVKLADQMWVIPIASYYHALYVEAVLDYAQLLSADAQYTELADLCNAAIRIEPYHEYLHALLVKALLYQGKRLAALNHYETATEFLYRNLGVRPSNELRALYQEIMKEQKGLELDLDVIMNDLRETASRPGMFLCEYGFFREAYRMEARRIARQGGCLHLALLTVTLPDGKTPELRLLNDNMEQLLQVLRLSLRRGDVAARYSGAQYVLMLPSANYEDSVTVMERIVTAFNKHKRKNFLKLSYKLRQLDSEQLLIVAEESALLEDSVAGVIPD